MTTIEELIAFARANNCSDIHLTASLPPVFRYLGELFPGNFRTTAEENEQLILSMLSDKQKQILSEGQDLDFSVETSPGQRQRVNIYRQRSKLCAAIRILNQNIPSLEDLQLPDVISRLADEPRGLILVTGQTGSGKSTTLAAIIDRINMSRRCHIITIEDPIEYVHKNKLSMINQREVGSDVCSFAAALRSALREDPDVILVGEMRDYETIAAAVTAAETGHLVLSTVHTSGAAQTLDRIIDVFPPHNQGQIRTQLSGVLKAVISQQLLPLVSGNGRIVATEILIGTDAVLNLIRESKAHQLKTMMQAGADTGMHTLDASLAQLVREKKVTLAEALKKANSADELKQYLHA